MTAKTSQRPVHSFSTNFFGVVGYVNLVLVWLLVLTCALAFVPIDPAQPDTSTFTVLMSAFDKSALDSTQTTSSGQWPLKTLLFALLLPVIWAFCYVSSRIISRVVRRLIRLSGKKVTTGSFVTVKYTLLAIGLVILVTLLAIIPVGDSVRLSIALLGFVGGIGGVAAIAIQQQMIARHHVPIARVL